MRQLANNQRRSLTIVGGVNEKLSQQVWNKAHYEFFSKIRENSTEPIRDQVERQFVFQAIFEAEFKLWSMK